MTFLNRQAEKIWRVRARRENSDTQMDLLKIYGICCVAYSHCFTHGFRFLGRGLIASLYVIQLFIFASGYFYRQEREAERVKDYVLRCAKSYLLPFFVWNLLYGAGYTVLSLLGVARFAQPLSLYNLFIRPWMDNEQFLLNLPAWFLLSLFEIAVVQFLVRKILRPAGRLYVELGLLAVYFVLGTVAVWLGGNTGQHGPETIPLRLFVLLPYYQLGIVYRLWRDKLPSWAGIPVILILGPILFLTCGNLLGTTLYCYFDGPPLMIVGAVVSAVLIIAEICRLLAPLVKKSRAVYLWGRSTMYIMLHHMFVIYCIQGVLFLINHFVGLSGYEPSYFKYSVWYRYDFGHRKIVILYYLAALIVPVVVHLLYEQVILLLNNRRRRDP